MSLRRWRFPLVVTAWIAVVFWYWREYVPLVPTTVIPLDGDRRLAGALANGELVVRRFPEDIVGTWFSTGRGPVEFVDVRTGNTLRRLLDDNDQVVWWGALLRAGSNIVVRRGGTVRVVDVVTGEVRMAVPQDLAGRYPQLLPGGEYAAFFVEQTLRVFRVADGREVWSQGDIQSFGYNPVGPDYVVVQASSGAEWRDVATGEVDQRIQAPDQPSVMSPSGRYRIWMAGDEASVSDLATGREIGRLPLDVARLGTFVPGESEVVVPFDPGNGFRLARWRISDSRCLDPLPNGSFQYPGQVFPTGDGAGIVLRRRGRGFRLPATWVAALRSLGLRWDGVFVKGNDQLQVLDLTTGFCAGHVDIASAESPQPGWTTPAAEGLVVADQSRIRYYAAPYRRNWVWPAGWSIVPVLLAWAVRCLRRRRVQQPGSLEKSGFSDSYR